MDQHPTSRRFGQLVRMLASDQPGERAAAAQAIVRTLGASGRDIHDLANVVEAGLKLPVPVRRPRPPTTTPKPRRPDGRPLQMDQQIICDQQDGLFRACWCGGILFTVMPGIGPHAAQLVCDGCSRGGRWLSRRYLGGAE